MSYTKVISPNYETVGKRRRLTGFLGEVFDGETRISCFEYRTLSDAEVQTDLLVYELLSDPMRYSATQMDGDADPEPPEEEQGPCDDINITEPDRARCLNCHGAHYTQRCPEIRMALFAESITFDQPARAPLPALA
jgi:hypothetical protein